jgi:hypothetical protein
MRRGTPKLIAVSSFGEGSRRVSPLTAPAGASVKMKTRGRWPRVDDSIPLQLYPGAAGKTTVTAVPTPSRDSTHIRPL